MLQILNSQEYGTILLLLDRNEAELAEFPSNAIIHAAKALPEGNEVATGGGFRQ